MKKIIDIDDKTHLSLSIMALKLKTNLKNYIETILSTHAKNAIVEPHAGGGFKDKKPSTKRKLKH